MLGLFLPGGLYSLLFLDSKSSRLFLADKHQTMLTILGKRLLPEALTGGESVLSLLIYLAIVLFPLRFFQSPLILFIKFQTSERKVLVLNFI